MDIDELLVVCNNSFNYELLLDNQLEWIYSSARFMDYDMYRMKLVKSIIYYSFKTIIRLSNYNAVR